MQHNTIPEIIEISKSKPEEIFTLDDGRIVANGQVFKNKEEFEGIIKMIAKMGGFKNKIKKFFRFSK